MRRSFPSVRGIGAAWLALLLTVGLALSVPARAAEPDWPALSGRVVDEAGLLSAEQRADLERSLAEHETAAGNQLVVVTVTSLQGLAIEDYGVGLGRHWGIGQAGKDNGALLIVAPNEREVRIEVGYGLEGTLTDAISSSIIQTVILPQFRAGRFDSGIVAGAAAILAALGGTYQPDQWEQATPQTASSSPWYFGPLFPFLPFGVWFLIVLLIRHYARRHGYSSRGWSSGGGYSGGSFSSSSGGFSGGGGSFGGGGSSGRW